MSDTTPQLAVRHPSVRTVTGWTLFFMMLLRIAIGWHFFYEGAWKLVQPDWKATPYLLASAGPFRPVFRMMVKDPDGKERLLLPSAAQAQKDHIKDRYEVIKKHYKLTNEQAIELIPYYQQVDAIFADPDFQAQAKDYEKLLEEITLQETLSKRADYERERLVYMYQKKSKALAALLARAQTPLKAMENNILNRTGEKRLTAKQLAAGALPPEKSQTEWIDWANMIALTAVGICLILGLFTRLAALGGIGLLAMYYFAIPPWPGLPENPMAEGHYLIIDKNLIEMIALFMIMTSGIGRWGGVDGIIAFLCRRRLACCSVTPTKPY